jgi:hypothetical protein
MRALTWVRCFIDDQENRVWAALRGTPTGFDVTISLLKFDTQTPVTRVLKAGLTTLADATHKFEESCSFYNGKGYRQDIGFQRMLEELLSK